MSDNTTPPVATSSSGEIPVEILTAANAHLSHGKTFGGSPGAETPPISTVAHAFDSRLCVHCGKRRSAHDNYMSDQCPQGDGVFTTAPPPSVSQEGGMPNTRDARELLAPLLEQVKVQAAEKHHYSCCVPRMGDATDANAKMAAAGEKIIEAYASQSSTLASLQAENAGLRAKVEMSDDMRAVLAAAAAAFDQVLADADAGHYDASPTLLSQIGTARIRSRHLVQRLATPTPPQERP